MHVGYWSIGICGNFQVSIRPARIIRKVYKINLESIQHKRLWNIPWFKRNIRIVELTTGRIIIGYRSTIKRKIFQRNRGNVDDCLIKCFLLENVHHYAARGKNGRRSKTQARRSKLQTAADSSHLASLLYLQIRKPVFRGGGRGGGEYRFVAADAYCRIVARVRPETRFQLGCL